MAIELNSRDVYLTVGLRRANAKLAEDWKAVTHFRAHSATKKSGKGSMASLSLAAEGCLHTAHLGMQL